MSWELTPMDNLIQVRENRYKPGDKAIKGLKRIEKIDFSGNIFLSEKPSNTDMILVKQGDLVISGINVEKGALAIYQGEEDISATIHYSSYVYNKDKIDLKFLRFFLKSPEFIDAIKSQVPGGIKTEIKSKHILPLKVNIPSDLHEQKVIVERLESYNSKINRNADGLTYQLHLVSQLRQAFLREAMQGKLTAKWREENPDVEPASELLVRIKAEKEKLLETREIKNGKLQEAENLNDISFQIPKNWIWCKLDEICKNITDGTHQTPAYTMTGRVFLSAQNIKPFKFMPEEHKYVSEEDYQQYIMNRKPVKGDLLVARVGAGIGETAVIDRDIEFCFYVSLGLIQPFKEYVSSQYLAYVFNSPYGVKYAKGNISSKGGSAGNFNLGRIRSFLVPFPSIPEQQQIVIKLNELMLLCDKLEKTIKTSQQQNELLLQQVLREVLEPKQ